MSNVDYKTSVEGHTKIELLWTVPNFIGLLNNKSMKELRTEMSENREPRFRLKMHFLGRNNDTIDIYYLSPNPVLPELKLKICSYAQPRVLKHEKCDKVIPSNKWQYLTTLFKPNIVNSHHTYLMSNETSLQLWFELKYQLIVNEFKVEGALVPETQLSHDFGNLLNTGLFSDITMKSVEGNEYKVHKAVLASRSVVLKAHFEHNTVECQTNIVESPFENDVLIEVLTFIYSNEAPRVYEIPERLLAAADYYHLIRLKSLCEEALHMRLNIENAIETLQLADIHSAKVLKQRTLEFIKDGQAKLITDTEAWAKVKSIELIKALYENIVADDVETDTK